MTSLLLPVLGLGLLREDGCSKRAASWGLAVLAVAITTYIPFIVNIFRSGNSGFGTASFDDWSRVTLGAATTLLDFQTTLGFPSHSQILLGLLAAIVIAAIWRGRGEGITLSLWLATVLTAAIFITVRMSFFQTKIFAFSAFPLSILTAVAFLGKTRRLRWYSLLPALAMSSFLSCGLISQWRPGFRQEDFRHAAQFVQSQATAEDSVVLHLAWTNWVFSHYYPGRFFHPFPNNVDATTPVAEYLRPLLDSDVLWLVQAGVGLPGSGGDPDRVVQQWLSEHYPTITEVFPSGIDVRGYATRYRLSSLPSTASPLDVTYPNGLTLVGYRLSQLEFPSRDRWLHPPSTWVPIALYWSVEEGLESDVQINLVLEDEPGNVWGGTIMRETDVRAFYPPREWMPGDIVRWDFDINANAQIPAGEYKVVLRVNETGNDTGLAHRGGSDWFILAHVRLK